MASRSEGDDVGSVRERLVRAADAALSQQEFDDVSIDCVATRAGVSRTTAFRQLGGRQQMIAAVALRRSRRVAAECEELLTQQDGTFARLETAFVYVAGELSRDPIVREWLASTQSDDLGPEAFSLADRTLRPTLETGRRLAEIRTDIPTAEIIRWLMEQITLSVQQVDRDEALVVARVRSFVIPALSTQAGPPIPGSLTSCLHTLTRALEQTGEAVSALLATPSAEDSRPARP